MDVGLVCDSCSAFNPLGAKSCSRCGAGLSLDPPPLQAPYPPARQEPPSMAAQTPSFDSDYTRPGIPHTEPSHILCGSCGAAVIVGHKFCGHCGARMDDPDSALAEPPEPEHPPAEAAAPHTDSHPVADPQLLHVRGPRSTQFFGAMQETRAKLVVIKGDGMDGLSFTLAGDEHLAGRADTPILFEDDSFISPVHANFLYKTGRLVVRDQDSTNGVYIRIRGSVAIQFNDRFLIGEQVLRIESPPQAQGPEAIEDGTYFFASPPQLAYFRIVQGLLGGAVGMIHHSRKPAISIGRESNDINFPDDPFISGQHARLTLHEGQLTLTDLDSKNGTFLRINGEQVLRHGDYVFMGQQLLRVEIV
ncbi:MAG: FHA domain-containing protein [Myxococcota bacterium]